MTKGKYLQWRADDNEIALARQLADDYGVSVSDLFRFALNYLNEQKPSLTMTITKNPLRRAASITPAHLLPDPPLPLDDADREWGRESARKLGYSEAE